MGFHWCYFFNPYDSGVITNPTYIITVFSGPPCRLSSPAVTNTDPGYVVVNVAQGTNSAQHGSTHSIHGTGIFTY